MNCVSLVKSALCAILFLSLNNMAFADGDKVQFYSHGNIEDWVFNTKLVAVRADQIDESSLRSKPEHVASIEVSQDMAGTFVTYKLDANATKEDWLQVQYQLNNSYPSAKTLLAIRKVTDNQLIAKKDIFIDNQILLVFKHAMSRDAIAALEQKYNMVWVNENNYSLSRSGKFTYIFSSNNIDPALNSAALAAQVYEENDNVVIAQPNRVNLIEPQGATSDVDIDKAWHVNNNGQRISCGNLYGELNADAKIDEVWNIGITGKNIKVGVIDFYGFDYNHPDMQGQFLPGWDCINNTAYDANTFYYTNNGQAHGMTVSGIISAKGDNGIGSAGVAYDSKIVPLLINGGEAEVILALQKAIDPAYDVDVINMSFGSYFESPSIYTEILNVVNNGRIRSGLAKGVVVFASHGNDYYDDTKFPQFPSGHPEVISVGASTPDDRVKTPADTWNTGAEWGSNYGENLHVVAPGVCIYTTDLSGADGYSSGDFVGFQKTSAATPVVAGVAALILSNNPDMTWEEVRDAITDNADKTYSSGPQSYNYNYDASRPGHSMEMGYGRVNALKSVGGVSVSVEDAKTLRDNWQFTIESPMNNTLLLSYTLGEEKEVNMEIYDMTGKQIQSVRLNPNSTLVNVDLHKYLPGMYFARFANGEDLLLETVKFVKAQ